MNKDMIATLFSTKVMSKRDKEIVELVLHSVNTLQEREFSYEVKGHDKIHNVDIVIIKRNKDE